ncbi:MAG: alpha/beta fold hydrolase [Acidimicrobiales bacterium]
MESQRIAVTGGVELNVNTWAGDGPGFLLVHGLASNARLWDGVAEHLASQGLAVAAVDQRGHGRSDKPDEGYDFPTVCDDLMAVMAALAWHRPVVAGQSWGGNVVLELAFRQPGALAGVACVDGGTIELGRHFPDWDSCAAALAPPDLFGTRADHLAAMMRRNHPDWPASGIEGTMANFEIQPDGTVAPLLTRERHMKILHHLYDHQPSQRYSYIATPVLLVPAGSGSSGWAQDKPQAIDSALAGLPRGRVRWFESADHDIHAQYPVALADVLTEANDDGFFA